MGLHQGGTSWVRCWGLLRRCLGLWACRLLWPFSIGVQGSCCPWGCWVALLPHWSSPSWGVTRWLPGVQSAVSVRWATAFRLDTLLVGVELLLLLGRFGSLRLGWLRGAFGESAWSWTTPRVLRVRSGDKQTDKHEGKPEASTKRKIPYTAEKDNTKERRKMLPKLKKQRQGPKNQDAPT